MSSRFSHAAFAGFELGFRPWMRRRLHAIHMTGLPGSLSGDRPILLVANHVSWWDGFVLREVQRAIRPGAPLFTLMSRAELSRFPFFRLMGAVGIDGALPGTIRDAMRFLEAQLGRHADGVVSYFPQGRIWPSHRRPLGFRRGVEWFAHRLPVRVIPVGLHVEPLNTISPSFFVSLGESVEARSSAAELEHRVERELDAILGFLAAHGEDSPRAWPAEAGRLNVGQVSFGRVG